MFGFPASLNQVGGSIFQFIVQFIVRDSLTAVYMQYTVHVDHNRMF